MNKSFLVFVLSVVVLTFAKDNSVGHPVAFVPGIIGTVLHAAAKDIPEEHIPAYCPRNLDEFQIWFNAIFDFNYKCFRHYMKTNYSPITNNWDDTQGVTITVPKQGSVYAVDYLDPQATHLIKYFHNVITNLEEKGYQDRVNMTGCGYDWRHLPTEEWANTCRTNIENMVKSSGKKAILIGHSMGCPYSYYLLQTAPSGWVDKYIYKYIAASGAWMGSPRALDAMFTGLGTMVPAVISNVFAPLARTIPSVWFLLPWNEAFKGMVGVRTPKNNYSFADVPKILDMVGLAHVDKKYESARGVFEKFNNYDKMPNVPTIFVYGKDKQTIDTLVFDEEIKHHAPDEDWKHPDHVFGPGDGTVPFESLSYVPNKWKSKYPKANITIIETTGLSHLQAVTDKSFSDLILDEVFHDYN